MIYILISSIAFGMVAICRNIAVYRFRMRLVEVAYQKRHEVDFSMLMREYESVSYEEQFLWFWKPLSSFYSSASPLRTHGIIK